MSVDSGGSSGLVSRAALAEVFQLSAPSTFLVVLNMSHSFSIAAELAPVVGCAIGMDGSISDRAAITFTASFYQGLASGQSIEDAFNDAKAVLDVEHPKEPHCPLLVSHEDVDPSRLFPFSTDSGSEGARESGDSMKTKATPGRSTVFISYSHKDRKWLERLQVHLKPLEREGILSRWDDTMIMPGSQWRAEIKRALDSARVAILLISADFLASDFVRNNELPPLLEAARTDGATILPVILSPCRFMREESLARFQAVNDPTRPLNALPKAKQEEVLDRLSETIERALRS